MLPRRVTWSWIAAGYWRVYRAMVKGIRKAGVFSFLIGLGLWGATWVLGAFQLVDSGYFGELPEKEALRQPAISLATEVYSADRVAIGKLYRQERVYVPLAEIAPCVQDALIATEDIRFFQHGGVDYYAFARVAIKTLLLQNQSSGGGSTLSMQLAKNLYPRQEYPYASLLINKMREILIAHRLEQVLSKSEILTQYLNTISLSDNAFGIETGARRFFGHRSAELGPEQAAVLIGMLKAPTTYNPRLHPEASTERRNLVLRQMERYGYLNRMEADSLCDLPLELDLQYTDYHDGPAPYFMAYVRQWLQQWAAANPRPDGTHWDPFADGLRVYTTLDSRLQQHALAATREVMPRIQRNFERDWRGINRARAFADVVDRRLKGLPQYRAFRKQGYTERQVDSLMGIPAPRQVFTWEGAESREISVYDSLLHHLQLMQMGLVALDPADGSIRTWVGGIDHHFFQYDHVTSRRQTGSVFKPLVYATALEQGMAPCAYIPNEKVMFQEYDDWTPANSDQSYGGEYSMRGGLTQSVNVVAVNLIMEIGPERVISLARELGVEADIPAVPSIALGTADVSLLEMLQVYASFINGGKGISPQVVTRIEDVQGRPIYVAPTPKPRPVLTEPTPALMTRMLRSVADRGTARGLRRRYKLQQDLIGKTGTTQDQTDGWFVGATPGLLGGVWVGADDRSVHFRSMMYGQGASTALHVWGDFYRRIAADSTRVSLTEGTFEDGGVGLASQLDCDDLWFPLAMSSFQEWWQEQKRKDSLDRVRRGLPAE